VTPTNYRSPKMALIADSLMNTWSTGNRFQMMTRRWQESWWLAVAKSVRPFFKYQDGRLVHKRCVCELRAQDLRSERYSERGKKAAFAKYSKPNDLNARRMLVPTTRHNITRHTYSYDASQLEQASSQRVGEGKSLAEIIKQKGWS